MATKRAHHAPQGDPCAKCGLMARRHLVQHLPEGDPCAKCGLDGAKHYKKNRTHSQRAYYVGIDGEGQGRQDHRYVMLAWSNESGSRREAIHAPEGGRLSTVECLDFILGLPNAAKPFAFAFNYDLTKMLTDVDDDVLYFLFRPEYRQRAPSMAKYGPRPVHWNGYSLNFMNAKFTVKKGPYQTIIWDIFKFYQAKFTSALADWKVGEEEVLARMRLMKDKRAEFDKLTRAEILQYCYEECAYMATLARKLTEAHDEAGLTLRSYYGAGSTASAVLKSMGIDRIKRKSDKAEMDEAIAAAFFGGRFENSRIGIVIGPIYGYDISSAYPYQLTFMPCLECGKWEFTKKRELLTVATAACVHYGLGDPPAGMTWGPFPFRLKTGSIAFPSTSGGGWVWLNEYLQAEKMFPHVQFRGAWIYRTECNHRPFADIPRYYLERLRIGKEGAGIVIKLGTNAVYGKLAQSLGLNPPFQSWIWAGMITSNTRAQILEMLALHKDWSNMLMVATDGIYSRELIDPPRPRETGTGPEVTMNLLNPKGLPLRDDSGDVVNKPLGGWERKVVKSGVFLARPGVYFPLNISEAEVKQVRARGVGRGVMVQNWQLVVDAWKQGLPGCKLADVTRFHGARSSIGRKDLPGVEGQHIYTRHIDPDTGKPRYGQWTTRPIEMSFNPLPKRGAINADGTLTILAFPRDVESKPYDRSLSIETIVMKMLAEETMEQPDGGDLSDYEDDFAPT